MEISIRFLFIFFISFFARRRRRRHFALTLPLSLPPLSLLPSPPSLPPPPPTKKKLSTYTSPSENQKKPKEPEVRHVEATPSSLFFRWNERLGPPYHVLVDTNFINHSIKNKIDLVQGMMDCLYAECIPCVTECVVAELEKLGPRYRVALRVAKDPRLERLPCDHRGTYADDCLCQRAKAHRCYIVATCDRDLRRRVRKIPGVPVMYLSGRRYTVERLPEATLGGGPRT